MSLTGQRIKDLRLSKGMAAEELAAKVGVAKTSIYRYETGAIEKMPATVLVSIADVLGVSTAYLLGVTNNPNETQQNKSTENEIVTLVQSMSEDEKQMLLKIIKGMKS
nr:MAG TPA: repressor protein [Caudoviricetes sp.]